MNDKLLAKICLVFLLINLFFLFFYETEFKKSSISNLLINENSKGLVFGRVDYVIKSTPVTIFILNDGNKSKVFYHSTFILKKNDFVKVFAKSEKYAEEIELFAYKIVLDN
jgi:uncharacterized membrane protein